MIFVRHGKKEYSNGKSENYSCDPSLTSEGIVEAIDKFQNILEKYGIPEKIISSPFERTRQTAEIAQSVIYNISGKKIDIYFDRNLGEYLGNQAKSNPNIKESLRNETLMLNPHIKENWYAFHNRIKKYCNGLKTGNVWHISHGLVIQKIAECYGYKIRHPSEVSGIIIYDKNLEII